MRAYTYTGPAPVTYPWGVVAPGAIAYFPGRPPDVDWTEYVAPAAVVAAEESADAESGAAPAGEAGSDSTADAALAARPNKAAAAEDWKAFAVADGGFQESTGLHPDDATRKAIVDHYTGTEGTGQ